MENPVLTEWLTLPGHLAAELAAARARAFPVQQEFAARMGWSASKVSRAERGLTLLEPADVIAWAEACREDPQRFATLRAGAEKVNRGTEAADVNWDRMFEVSSRVLMVENDMIPGPVQTIPYRTALLIQLDRRARSDAQRDPPDVRAERITARWDTLRDHARQFVFVMTDGALLRSAAPPEAMVDQLGRLLSVMTLPNVDVHVIVDRAGTPIPAFPAFHIYYPADVVHCELATDGWWSTDTETRLAHERLASILIEAAASDEAAADRIRWAQAQHRTQAGSG